MCMKKEKEYPNYIFGSYYHCSLDYKTLKISLGCGEWWSYGEKILIGVFKIPAGEKIIEGMNVFCSRVLDGKRAIASKHLEFLDTLENYNAKTQ